MYHHIRCLPEAENWIRLHININRDFIPFFSSQVKSIKVNWLISSTFDVYTRRVTAMKLEGRRKNDEKWIHSFTFFGTFIYNKVDIIFNMPWNTILLHDWWWWSKFHFILSHQTNKPSPPHKTQRQQARNKRSNDKKECMLDGEKSNNNFHPFYRLFSLNFSAC